MTVVELLSDANQWILVQWRQSQPSESEALLMLRTEVHFFIWRTGQLYRFEDHLQRCASEPPPVAASWPRPHGARMMRVREILTQLRDAQQTPEHRHLVQVGIDEMDFLASSDQQEEFYDYLETYYLHPPPVIARFGTREEAETWLNQLTEPPSSAYLLVGDEYFELHYERDRGTRSLVRDHALERFIEAVTKRGLPSMVATFATRAEAEDWWAKHPNPPISVWVQVSGEPTLAIHHKKLSHRTLHPLSILQGWEEQKKKMDEVAKAQQAEEPSDADT